jgi:hypothetical protein
VTEGDMVLVSARAELLDGAKQAARYGVDWQNWLDHEAPQWALDAVSEQDLSAIREMAWRGLP